jgi:signal transduction histidine kinase
VVADTPDYLRFFDGLNGLIDEVNAGDAGLTAIYHLLEIGQEAVGADGMSFVEYAPAGGRVIAATGGSQWAVGRHIDTSDAAFVRLLTGRRTRELSVDELPPDLASQVRGRGLTRLLYTRVELAGLVVGSVHAYFKDPDGKVNAEQRSIARFVASWAARLYGEHNGLPVHSSGPLVAALADGLAIVGRDGLVRLWNPAAERVTGFESVDVLGTPLPLPVPELGKSLDYRLTDGRWLQIFAADLAGSDTRVVTFRDVTEVRRRERDRDLFLAVTSHELRTPVTVIKGFTDTLGEHWDSLDDRARRDAVRTLSQRAGDLARLVDRLLSAASHAGAAIGGTVSVPFDLVEALHGAARGLPTDLRANLRVELPATLPKAHGDRTSIAMLLTELVTNAYKYSPIPPDVSVSADFDGQTVFFRVADRGIGVRPEHVERAFERFWQGEADDQRRYGGVGLGLYLVRRIAERQNGWVSLRPRERGGTVAEVRLPRADVAPREA